MARYYEDLEVGAVRDVGTVTVTGEDIVNFGERWDPLPQHTDPAAAPESPAGGLIASGLHTMCLSNRLVAAGFRRDLAGAVGLGFADLRWPAPVEPGDEVTVRHEVVGKRPSESDPTYGVLTARITGEVAGKGLVVDYTSTGLVRRRDAAGDER